jgi:hypothetical protein
MIDHKQMRYVHGISRKPLPEGRVLVHNHVITHGVIPGSSHTQALGISSPRIDKAHLMGPCNHGGSQWSSMSDWMSH